MFFGEGAGSLPAASAVVGDVIEVARHIQSGCLNLVGCTCNEEYPVRSIDELVTRYYIRLVVKDQPGVLAATAKVFGDHGVSLDAVTQKGSIGDPEAEIVYVTYEATEKSVRESLAEIEGLDVVDSVGTVIRVEDL